MYTGIDKALTSSNLKAHGLELMPGIICISFHFQVCGELSPFIFFLLGGGVEEEMNYSPKLGNESN